MRTKLTSMQSLRPIHCFFEAQIIKNGFTGHKRAPGQLENSEIETTIKRVPCLRVCEGEKQTVKT